DGMGHLRITEKGLKLEGDSEFLKPLYAKEIQSRPPFLLIFTGSNGIEAHSKLLEVKSNTGKLLFSADEREVVVGADRLRVLGNFHHQWELREIEFCQPAIMIGAGSPTEIVLMSICCW
ncbi:UNVERIFIED_CONTAM: hypothetical protein FKN15_022262, partial [Acipenser sinensis]